MRNTFTKGERLAMHPCCSSGAHCGSAARKGTLAALATVFASELFNTSGLVTSGARVRAPFGRKTAMLRLNSVGRLPPDEAWVTINAKDCQARGPALNHAAYGMPSGPGALRREAFAVRPTVAVVGGPLLPVRGRGLVNARAKARARRSSMAGSRNCGAQESARRCASIRSAVPASVGSWVSGGVTRARHTRCWCGDHSRAQRVVLARARVSARSPAPLSKVVAVPSRASDAPARIAPSSKRRRSSTCP